MRVMECQGAYRLGNVCFLVSCILLAISIVSDEWIEVPPDGKAGLWVECGHLIGNGTDVSNGSNYNNDGSSKSNLRNRGNSRRGSTTTTVDPDTSTATTESSDKEEEETECENMDISSVEGFIHGTRILMVFAGLCAAGPIIGCRILKIEHLDDSNFFDRYRALIFVAAAGILAWIGKAVYENNAKEHYGEKSSLGVVTSLLTAFIVLAFVSVVLMLSPKLKDIIGGGWSDGCCNCDLRRNLRQAGRSIRDRCKCIFLFPCKIFSRSRVGDPSGGGTEDSRSAASPERGSTTSLPRSFAQTNTARNNSRSRRRTRSTGSITSFDSTVTAPSEADIGDGVWENRIGTGPDLRGFTRSVSDPAPRYEDLPPRQEPSSEEAERELPPPSYEDFLRGGFDTPEPPSAPRLSLSSYLSSDGTEMTTVVPTEPPPDYSAAIAEQPAPPPSGQLGPPPAYEESVV